MDFFRHRVLLTYEADAESITPGKVIQQILDAVEAVISQCLNKNQQNAALV